MSFPSPRIRLAIMSWLVTAVTALAARPAHAQSCSVPAQCTQLNAPVCSSLGVCSPCLTNYHPGGGPLGCPNSSAPYCWQSDAGILGGACTQCGPGAGNSSLCDSSHPVCLSDGTCGCATSADCQAGFTCDPGTKACVPAGNGGGDGGASDGGGNGGDGGGSSDGSASSDGSIAKDGSASDATVGSDGSAEDASSPSEDASQDGSSLVSDGEAQSREAGGEGGASGDGKYIEGGGCACTSGARTEEVGPLSALALVLACASLRRRGRR
jgi:hypothetical protein